MAGLASCIFKGEFRFAFPHSSSAAAWGGGTILNRDSIGGINLESSKVQMGESGEHVRHDFNAT